MIHTADCWGTVFSQTGQKAHKTDDLTGRIDEAIAPVGHQATSSVGKGTPWLGDAPGRAAADAAPTRTFLGLRLPAGGRRDT